LDDEIVELANAVEAADLPASLRREALQAALFRVGFQLRDNGFAFGDSDRRPQGLIFEVADLDLIAAAMDSGIAQTLDDWAGVLAEAVTATEGADGAGYRAALLETPPAARRPPRTLPSAPSRSSSSRSAAPAATPWPAQGAGRGPTTGSCARRVDHHGAPRPSSC
jgi:hypothetical protein